MDRLNWFKKFNIILQNADYLNSIQMTSLGSKNKAQLHVVDCVVQVNGRRLQDILISFILLLYV